MERVSQWSETLFFMACFLKFYMGFNLFFTSTFAIVKRLIFSWGMFRLYTCVNTNSLVYNKGPNILLCAIQSLKVFGRYENACCSKFGWSRFRLLEKLFPVVHLKMRKLLRCKTESKRVLIKSVNMLYKFSTWILRLKVRILFMNSQILCYLGYRAGANTKGQRKNNRVLFACQSADMDWTARLELIIFRRRTKRDQHKRCVREEFSN
jgi:hypothetical protein